MIIHRKAYISDRRTKDGQPRVTDSWYFLGVILLYRRQRFA